jgi:hypothetical protein
MDNLKYNHIRMDTNEDKDLHESVYEDIKLARHNIEERAIYSYKNYFLNGVPVELTKENSITASNVQRSREYDPIFTKGFLYNKSKYLNMAVQN